MRSLATCFLFASCLLPVTCNAIDSNQKLIHNFRQKHLNYDHDHKNDIDKKIDNKQWVKNELILMSELDQQVRDVNIKVSQRCQRNIESCASDLKDADALMIEVDTHNLQILKTLMHKYPWFKISEFGKDGADAAWLLVQHTDDLDLQIKVLFIMDYLAKIGESDPQNYALLYDRTSLSYQDFGIKQRYGSQFRLSDDRQKAILEPYEGSLAEVDARRKVFGMESMAENAKRIAEVYHVQEIVGLDTEI